MDFDLEFWKELDSSLPGWMSEEEARFLVENVQGKVYLEIGVAYGKSLRVVKHHFTDMWVYGVDKIDHGVEEKLKHELLSVKVKLGDANEISRDWEDESIDTIFIDGNHLRDGVLSDTLHWYNKLKIGGRLIYHDYRRDKNHEGVDQVVDFIKPLLDNFQAVKSICAGTKKL